MVKYGIKGGIDYDLLEKLFNGININFQAESIDEHIVQYRDMGFNPNFMIETNTPLNANEEYIGEWIDLQDYGFSYIIVLVYSDQDGTLYVEQSHDGSTIIRSDSLEYVGGSTKNNLAKIQIMGRYIRLRYVNGSNDQTTFILTRRFSIC